MVLYLNKAVAKKIKFETKTRKEMPIAEMHGAMINGLHVSAFLIEINNI